MNTTSDNILKNSLFTYFKRMIDGEPGINEESINLVMLSIVAFHLIHLRW